MQVSKSKVNLKFNPTSCVNCCANWNADTNGVARSIGGKELYTRLFAECVVAIPDLQNLMVDVNNVQAMITIIRELAYSKLKKELSHVGFVSMTVDQAAQFYNNGHGKQVLDIMNRVKPRHPRSLITEPAAQGFKRKATEGEGDGLGKAPDPSRGSQPNAEKEEKKQRVIDGRRAALGFLESMEKCMGEMGICMKCANLAHDGDCKDIEDAAGNEEAMKKIRELLSSDPVSSDEDMGDTEEPSSSTSKNEKEEDKQGKKQSKCIAIPSIWWRWLTRLRGESYNAVAWTSPTIRVGTTGHSKRR